MRQLLDVSAAHWKCGGFDADVRQLQPWFEPLTLTLLRAGLMVLLLPACSVGDGVACSPLCWASPW